MLRARPININTARAATLSTIPSVSMLDARRIVAYRAHHGAFAHLTDLQNVDGLSPDDFRTLRPFITIRAASVNGSPVHTSAVPPRNSHLSWSQALRAPDVGVSYRWGRQIDLGRGYAPDTTDGGSGYQGGPVRHVVRAQAHFGDRLELAGALDKDPGEAWHWDPRKKQPGFDHMAGSIAANGIGPVRTVILGDYTVSSGHGIGLWRGMAFGKGADATSGVIRSGRGIAPFASTEENRFFRGAAASINLRRLVRAAAPSWSRPWDATAYGFVSRRRLDASVDVHPESGQLLVSSLRAGGMHRTQTEVASRDAVREHAVGGGVDIEGAVGAVHVSTGGAVFARRLAHPLAPPTRPDEAFDRRGAVMRVESVYASGQWRSLLLTGEGARMTDRSIAAPRHSQNPSRSAIVAALAYDDGQRLDAVVHVRQFGSGYDNPYATAFSETATQNEQGVYVGLRLRVGRGLHLAGYVDQYAFRWLRYNVSRPTTGRDTRIVLNHQPRPWIKQTIQFRSETKEQNGSSRTDESDSGPPRSPLRSEPVAQETRQSLRWSGDVEVSPRFVMSTRIEGTRVWTHGGTATTHYGWMLAQDLRWKIHPRLEILGRLSMFDTDGFSARVYAYERDVRYAFRVPALFGRGERSYVMGRVNLGHGATLEVKYGVTRYNDRSVIGSGLNELQRNRRREIRTQIRWRF